MRLAQDVLPIFEAWAPGDDRPRRCIEATRAYVAARLSGDADAAWAAWAVDAAGAAEVRAIYSNWLVVRIERGY